MLCIFLYTRGWSLGGLSWLLMRVRDMCGLRRFHHISGFSRGILGYTLFEFLELRLTFVSFIILVWLVRSLLVLGRSSRRSLRGDSTVYWGIRL
jgi:hypothetical protein